MGVAFTDCCRVRGVCCEPNRPRIEKRKSIEHIFIPYKQSGNKAEERTQQNAFAIVITKHIIKQKHTIKYY